MIQKIKTDRNKGRDLLLWAVFAAWLILNAVLLQRHELWRDEANVWLIGRELSPLSLLRELKYQGHPCLWYLLVMPFAKLGMPFRLMGLLSLAIMAAAAWLFLWKAPVNGALRAVSLFSPVFTYFYPVIARNYCLAALLLLLLAWSYPMRNQKCIRYGLLLGLLVQTDTIALPMAGMISLAWFWENFRCMLKERKWNAVKRSVMGLCIPLASLFLLIAQFYRISDSPEFQVRGLGMKELLGECRNYCTGILNRLTGWETGVCFVFLILLALVLLFLSVRIKDGWAAAAFGAEYLFLVIFSVMVYQLNIWHYLVAVFGLLWAIWVLALQIRSKRPEDRAAKISHFILQALLCASMLFMFRHWNTGEELSNLDNALNGLYSDGENTAAYIEENIDSRELIVSVNIPWASTVLAYLDGYEFYFAANGQPASYADWSEAQSGTISYEQLLEWVRGAFPDKTEFYLLGSPNSCLYDADELYQNEVLYQTAEETVRGEEYTVYRIRLQ